MSSVLAIDKCDIAHDYRTNSLDDHFNPLTVNKDLHWSLCVVANPGMILEHKKRVREGRLSQDERELDKPFPCLLMLDSLGCHNSREIAGTVRGWLNFEWDRRNINKKGEVLFTRESMIATKPGLPKQPNGYDCGIYVCRYTYGLLRLRGSSFSYRDAGVRGSDDQMHHLGPLFGRFLQESGQFDFNQGDVERMRAEMKVLVTNLCDRSK